MGLYYPEMTASFAGNTAGTTLTQFTGNLVLAGGANVTLSNSTDSAGQTVSIVGGAGGGGGFTGGVSNLGNTSGSTGTVSNQIIFAGGNNITLSQSTAAGGATITISGPNTAAQSVESQSFGMSNLGNTSGTTGIASGGQVAFYLAGGNNITLSQSIDGASGTITISGPSGGAGDGYNILAAGTQTANTTGTILFSNSNGVTFGMSASTRITASVAGQTNPTIRSTVIGNDRGWAQASATLGQNSLYIFPHNLQQSVDGSIVKIPVMVTNSSSAFAAHTRGYTARIGAYSRHSTNSTILMSAASTSYTASFSANSNVSWNIGIITGLGNATSYNTVSASSAGLGLSASIHGARELLMGFAAKITAGEYWWAFLNSSSSAGAAGNLFNLSFLIASSSTQNQLGVSINATNSGIARNIGLGTYSVTTGALPASISMTQINQAATNPIFYWLQGTR